MSNVQTPDTSCIRYRYLIHFHFNSRAKEWAREIGRIDLLERSRLYHFCICSDHFTDDQYNCPSLRYTCSTLLHNAVPKVIKSLETEKHAPVTTISEKNNVKCKSKGAPVDVGIQTSISNGNVACQTSLNTNSLGCQTKFANLERDCLSMTSSKQGALRTRSTQTSRKAVTANSLRKKIKDLQNKLRKMSRLEKERKRLLNEGKQRVSLEGLPPNLMDFIRNQVANHKRKPRGRRYSPAFYRSCLLLYHKSRGCYAALRHIFYMPSHRGLQNQLQLLFDKVRIQSLAQIISRNLGAACDEELYFFHFSTFLHEHELGRK